MLGEVRTDDVEVGSAAKGPRDEDEHAGCGGVAVPADLDLVIARRTARGVRRRHGEDGFGWWTAGRRRGGLRSTPAAAGSKKRADDHQGRKCPAGSPAVHG